MSKIKHIKAVCVNNDGWRDKYNNERPGPAYLQEVTVIEWTKGNGRVFVYLKEFSTPYDGTIFCYPLTSFADTTSEKLNTILTNDLVKALEAEFKTINQNKN